jgi:hypothetical protein
MRGVSIFGPGVHPCGWAAIVFAVSLITRAGIGIDSEGGGVFVYAIPVSGNVGLAAFLATTAGMGGTALFVVAYATVSIVRSFREGQLQPRGFEVIGARDERRAGSRTPTQNRKSP